MKTSSSGSNENSPKSSKNTFKLTPEQQNIYEKIIKDIKEVRNGDIFSEHSWLSLKGPAGTGKTFLSKIIVKKLLEMNFNVAVVAPTHQAVKVIKNTIGIKDNNKLSFASLHSFLGLKPGKIDPTTGERKFVKEQNKKRRSEISSQKFDICILDESSMVSQELFNFLKEEMYLSHRIKSFLFIGDEFQLLPVKDTSLKHSIYNNNVINHYNLTELIRNPDMEVINFVTSIRNMIEKKGTKFDLFNYLVKERDTKNHNKIKFYNTKKKFISEFIKKDRLGCSEDCIATFTNTNVDLYNEKIRNYYTKGSGVNGEIPEIHPEDLFVVQQTTQGTQSTQSTQGNLNYNYRQDAFMNSEILKLKESVFSEFDFKGKIFKGYKCTTTDNRVFNKLAIESKDEYTRTLNLLKIKAIEEKSRELWRLHYELLDLFLDVRPQFANTVHKLQGSSYLNIYCDLSDLGYLDDQTLLRLFYVAVTRSKNEVHILL